MNKILILIFSFVILTSCELHVKVKDKDDIKTETVKYKQYIVVDRISSWDNGKLHSTIIIKSIDSTEYRRVGTSDLKDYYENYKINDTIYYKSEFWDYILTKERYKDEQRKNK